MDQEETIRQDNPYASDQTRSGRWTRVLRFLKEWGRGINPGDGVALSDVQEAERRLGFPLPSALSEWLLMSGMRSSDLRAETQFLRLPSQLMMYDGYLIFYDENQGLVTWGIAEVDLTLDDPPVYVDASDVNVGALGWVLENSSVSEFVFQMEVTDTITYAKFYASGPSSPAIADKLDRLVPSLGLPSWHWPIYPTRHYGMGDILVEVNGASSVALAARTEAALRDGLKLLSPVEMSIVNYGK